MDKKLTGTSRQNGSVGLAQTNAGKKGFIQILVVIVIALVILHLLGISIPSLLAKPGVHDFAVYVKQMLILVWDDLKEIFHFVKSA